jgi:hypothetical protein
MTARGRRLRRACAFAARVACAGSAVATSPWPTLCAASGKRFVRIAARFAERGHRSPAREARVPRECMRTHRLAARCALCGRYGAPVHAPASGALYCPACAGRDAARVKPSEAGPGHEALTAHRGPSENRPRIGLPAAAIASLSKGKGGTRPPKRGLSGPFLAPPRPGRPWPALAACGLAHRVPLARATGPVEGPLRPGKAPDTTPPVPRVSWRLLRSARWPVRGVLPGPGNGGCEGLRGLARDSVEKSFNCGG